nr:reverse transcriptase domain-containing protein [Tanacetum cinerariifolium]
MLKALLSNKEKLLELANTPLNENCLAVILKKLPKKLGDPRKFLIPCGFSELKCKSLSDLGSSINLMPLSVWKKLGLLELISTRMTLELANRAICTPAGIARDVFVLVGKFTFSVDFIIVDYESDPRVPLILGRPFLRTARALIDVHEEEMILCDGDERLTLNIRHDTSSYSNLPQKESINMINIFNDSYEDYHEDLFSTNHLSGNPTFASHTDLTSSEVKDDIFDLKGDIVLIEKLLNPDSTKDLSPPDKINPLSGSTTSSSPNHLLKEFADELALITFLPGNDDVPIDIESDLREIEYLLNHDPTKKKDSILEDSVDEDNLAILMTLFLIPFPRCSPMNMLLIIHLRRYMMNMMMIFDFLPSPEYDSFLFEYFSEVDALPSTNNEDKMLKALLSNKEKLLKLANIPLNENCSTIILKKLPEKLGDPRKFLIPCGFSVLKCKALADLGASINLMPLSIWKKLGLPELISICMTLELANWAICTPVGIAKYVFVLVGKFTFLADFVIVDYESDPRVPLILGRPFLRTAHALIDVHGEEMIFHDGDERLTLNMRHDTSSYSNQPQKESINMINIYDDSYEDYLKYFFTTNCLSGNPTFSSHTDLTSPEVINPLSGSTTSSSLNHLLKEFADELAIITFPSGNDDLLFDIKFDLRGIEYLLNHDPTKEMDSILEDSVDE